MIIGDANEKQQGRQEGAGCIITGEGKEKKKKKKSQRIKRTDDAFLEKRKNK